MLVTPVWAYTSFALFDDQHVVGTSLTVFGGRDPHDRAYVAPTTSGALAPGTTHVVVSVQHLVGPPAVSIKDLTFAAGPDGDKLTAQHVRSLGGGRFAITLVTPSSAAGTGQRSQTSPSPSPSE